MFLHRFTGLLPTLFSRYYEFEWSVFPNTCLQPQCLSFGGRGCGEFTTLEPPGFKASSTSIQAPRKKMGRYVNRVVVVGQGGSGGVKGRG